MSTVGEILKNNRQEKGLTIETISIELMISKDILIKLENDEIKNDPDIVFYFGHLRSYANLLKLSPDELIQKFKDQISFEKITTKEISKPSFVENGFKFQKYISGSLILIVFVSFYFLFVNESNNETKYALIPDLPEAYVPIIEKSNLELSNNKKISNKVIQSNKEINIRASSVVASNNISEHNQNDHLVTLKLLNSTWVQIRDMSDNIILSKLMEKDEEFSYILGLDYNITAGNAGNILVLIDNNVRGKIGKYGEILDSYILDNNFKN